MGAVKRSCRDAASGTCAHKGPFVSACSISQKGILQKSNNESRQTVVS